MHGAVSPFPLYTVTWCFGTGTNYCCHFHFIFIIIVVMSTLLYVFDTVFWEAVSLTFISCASHCIGAHAWSVWLSITFFQY
jgi:hypothetical protein